MIKLIVSDLDGTLLGPGEQQLDRHVVDLIEDLLNAGFLVAAASGRQYGNVYRMFGRVAERLIYICENGSLVKDQHQMLHMGRIDRCLRDGLIADIQKRDMAEILFSGPEYSYINPKSDYYYNLVVNRMKNDVKVVKDFRKIEDACVKVSIYQRTGITFEDENHWKEYYGEKMSVLRSSEKWLDFMPLGTSKGRSLQLVMDQKGVLPSECMVFGDQENDLDMMRVAEHTYGMRHGSEKLKNSVKEIIGHPKEILLPLLNTI